MISNHQMIQALKCWLLLPNHPVAKGLRKMNPEMLIGLSEGRHPICVHVICQLANCEILSHSWKTKYWKNTWKDVMSEIQSPIHAPPFRISIEEFKSCVHLVVSANVPAPSYSTATCKARFHLILFRPVLRGRQTKIQKKKGENGRMASQSPAVLSGSSPGFSTSPRLCRAMENAVRLLPRSSLFWDPWNSRHLQLGRGSLFLDTPANLWLGYTSHSDSLHHFYPLLSMPYPWWKMM